MGVTQSEPEASEMAQKTVVHPIEQIPAYTVGVGVTEGASTLDCCLSTSSASSELL